MYGGVFILCGALLRSFTRDETEWREICTSHGGYVRKGRGASAWGGVGTDRIDTSSVGMEVHNSVWGRENMSGIYATSRAKAGSVFGVSNYEGRGRSAAIYIVGVVRDDGSRSRSSNAVVTGSTAGSVNST